MLVGARRSPLWEEPLRRAYTLPGSLQRWLITSVRRRSDIRFIFQTRYLLEIVAALRGGVNMCVLKLMFYYGMMEQVQGVGQAASSGVWDWFALRCKPTA